METVVIAGAGHGGVQVADSLRSLGFTGQIILCSDDAEAPYQRPPLSKDFMVAHQGEPLPLRGGRFFAEKDIDLRLGCHVVDVDPEQKTVELSDGSSLNYTWLVLATGAVGRKLDLPQADGIHELRTLADATRLQAALRTSESAVVVGAGFIGLEFAAAARKSGLRVTVIERADRALARAVTPVISDYVTKVHRGKLGVNVLFGTELAEVEVEDNSVKSVVLGNGDRVRADLLILGIGVEPRIELAQKAGLQVDDGIVVDATLRTSDPSIFAVGDCARFPHVQGQARLESVQNASDHGRHVAEAILGSSDPYEQVCWFWSNQGPIRLQIAGLRGSTDTTVTVGDPENDKFSVLSFNAGTLVAVESINNAADHLAARKVLASGIPLTSAEASEPDFTLKSHAQALV